MAIIKQKQDFAKNVSLQEYNTKTQQNLFHYFLKNEVFLILKKVMYRLCENVNRLISEIIKSITCRDWIDSITSSGISIIIVKNDVLFLQSIVCLEGERCDENSTCCISGDSKRK